MNLERKTQSLLESKESLWFNVSIAKKRQANIWHCVVCGHCWNYPSNLGVNDNKNNFRTKVKTGAIVNDKNAITFKWYPVAVKKSKFFFIILYRWCTVFLGLSQNNFEITTRDSLLSRDCWGCISTYWWIGMSKVNLLMLTSVEFRHGRNSSFRSLSWLDNLGVDLLENWRV